MHIITRFTIYAVVLATAMGCGSSSSTPDGEGLLRRAQQAWTGDWHAVWQVEWDGAPVREPLTAEVWHAADGRLRIETLEVPSPALSGLTLVENGTTSWLYDLRHDQITTGSDRQITACGEWICDQDSLTGGMTMIHAQNTLVAISNIVVTFFVPAVVWITLGAGLLQLAYVGIRRLSTTLSGSRKLAKTAR